MLDLCLVGRLCLAHVPAAATADASATAFVDDFFKKGNRRPIRPSECVAAASASASAFSSAKGGDALSFAKAQAEASGFSWGSPAWRNKFIGACTARASASAESFSSGGKGGSFAGKYTLQMQASSVVVSGVPVTAVSGVRLAWAS